MFEYAILIYSTSINLGDEIQSIASLRMLQNFKIKISYFIDRDTSDVYHVPPEYGTREDLDVSSKIEYSFIEKISPELLKDKKIKCIYNGWFDGAYFKFPLPEYIIPLFISFHINEVDKDKSYKAIIEHDKEECKFILEKENAIAYFRKYQPIGCRDYHTVNKFREKGIEAYFSGCMTMTTKPLLVNKDRFDTYIVDVQQDLYDLIPEDIKKRANHISHISHEKDPSRKLDESEFLLDMHYLDAGLVITSRLHATLPCLAYDTPVVMLYEGEKSRFGGLDEYITIYDRDNINTLDWENISKNKNDINNIRTKIREEVEKWIK